MADAQPDYEPDDERADPRADERDDQGDAVETFHVRDGQLVDSGSWLYVWVTVSDGRVIYVGATGILPAVRTWLHLHDPDPTVGRVAARLPAVSTEELEVVAARLPDGAPRQAAREDLVHRLHEADLLSAVYVGERPADAASTAPGAVRPQHGSPTADTSQASSALLQRVRDIDRRHRRAR